MASPSPSRDRLTLLALWLVFYASFTLFTPPLLDDADSVHAEVAREMLLRHDFVTLYANGIRYLEKAPLYYWLEAACIALFGPHTAATRLPLAFAVLALALLTETFTRRAFPETPRAGLYAGILTLSSFGIFIFSRINIPDILVCLLLTAALYVFWLTEQQPRPTRALCFLFAAACALDVLTKGLIGIVFPIGIVLVYLVATRGLLRAIVSLKRYRPLESILLFLAIAAPWHILAALANPGHGNPGHLSHFGGRWSVPYPTDGNVHGWAWFYFINEQVYRYLNIRVPHDYDTVPLWLFLGLIFIWLMPWSAFLPSALARALPARDPAWRDRLRRHTLTPPERTDLLLILWAALPLVFFSLSTRQEYYVLPALPPMIFLTARLLASAEPLRRARATLAILGTAAALACLVLILHTRAPAPSTDLSTLLQQNPGDYALSFGHFLDLNAQAMGLFRLPLALTAIAFGIGLPLAWYLRRNWSNTILAASAFLFLLAAWQGLRIFSPVLTSYRLAERIAPQLRPPDLVVLHGEYESGSTLGFYLRRNTLHIVEGRSSNLWYGSFFPDAPAIFETRDQINAEWNGPRRIFLWEDPSDPDRSPLMLPAPVYVIASSGGKQILSNQPSREPGAP